MSFETGGCILVTYFQIITVLIFHFALLLQLLVEVHVNGRKKVCLYTDNGGTIAQHILVCTA